MYSSSIDKNVADLLDCNNWVLTESYFFFLQGSSVKVTTGKYAESVILLNFV